MKTEKQLTRQQRRFNERVNAEVNNTLKQLTIKFYHFFMENDPNGNEVSEKQKELSTKWKMYCKRMGLIEEAFKIFDREAEKILNEYKEERETV